MDPLAAATAFGTIVSLIADFRSQRSGQPRLDYDEFIAWLAEERHDEVLSLVRQNAVTAVSIKALLNEDREALRQRLDHLDRTLAALASTMEGFGDLAGAIRPDSRLSRQTLSFLRQFDKSGGSRALEVKYLDGRIQFVLMDANGKLTFDDPRFLDDDLMTLVDIGLLRLDYNPKGDRVFVFTRYAADFLRSVPKDV